MNDFFQLFNALKKTFRMNSKYVQSSLSNTQFFHSYMSKASFSNANMASKEHDQDSSNLVTLICTEFNFSEADEKLDDSYQITISTAEISVWDLPSILSQKVLRIVVNPNRQVSIRQPIASIPNFNVFIMNCSLFMHTGSLKNHPFFVDS